jgi:hypothetical protein
METETTPQVVADMIAEGAKAKGARVTYSNATDRGRFGVMHIQMTDGEVVTIKIELEA